jgi:tetratricopeptide (TPR) repeat protein
MKRDCSKLCFILICAVLALTTFIVYERVRNYDFVSYDDVGYVYGNQHVRAGLTAAGVKWAFTTTDTGNWHPLTWLSLMLDCQLFGIKPGWNHMINVLFHVANTLLLFIVLRRMTGALWRSAFVAALFALHPLHVESVAWIAERKDVLSGFFWMLTMLAYVRYTERTGIKRYLLMLLFFALGLMAKPMLVTLPFVLLLLDYWPLGRLKWAAKDRGENISNSRRFSSVFHLVAEKLPLFALSAASSAAVYIAQQKGGTMTSMEVLPLGFRVINAATSYLDYVVKIFYPANLAVLYPYPKTFRMSAVIILLVGIAALFIFLARRRPWVTVGSLWYLGTLVPVIGIVQVGSQATADRYTYLPSIGIFIAVAWGAAEITARWKYQKIVLGALAALVLSALFVCTRVQVGYWKNDFTLYKHALEVTTNNSYMHERYATALEGQGKLGQAVYHYEQALQISPGMYWVYTKLGLIFLGQGKTNEAIEYFEKTLQLKPDYPIALNNLGVLLADQGKTDEAESNFEKAIRAEPDYLRSYYNMGKLKNRQKEYAQAVEYLEAALQKNPDWPEVCSALAEDYLIMGNAKQAAKYWRRVLELDPNDIKTLNNLAWLLATAEDPNLQDPADAVTYAEKIFKLTGSYQQPVLLDTLAAAYAAAGNFPKAVKTAEQALKLLEAAGRKDLAEKVRRELELYKSGRPYREKQQ